MQSSNYISMVYTEQVGIRRFPKTVQFLYEWFRTKRRFVYLSSLLRIFTNFYTLHSNYYTKYVNIHPISFFINTNLETYLHLKKILQNLSTKKRTYFRQGEKRNRVVLSHCVPDGVD